MTRRTLHACASGKAAPGSGNNVALASGYPSGCRRWRAGRRVLVRPPLGRVDVDATGRGRRYPADPVAHTGGLAKKGASGLGAQ